MTMAVSRTRIQKTQRLNFDVVWNPGCGYFHSMPRRLEKNDRARAEMGTRGKSYGIKLVIVRCGQNHR
jgi:hypothetical protein